MQEEPPSTGRRPGMGLHIQTYMAQSSKQDLPGTKLSVAQTLEKYTWLLQVKYRKYALNYFRKKSWEAKYRNKEWQATVKLKLGDEALGYINTITEWKWPTVLGHYITCTFMYIWKEWQSLKTKDNPRHQAGLPVHPSHKYWLSPSGARLHPNTHDSTECN